MSDWNAEMFVKLYSKMALALGVTPKSEDPEMLEMIGGPLPRRNLVGGLDDNPQSLLAMFNPGQYIPPNMDPTTKTVDSYELSVIFNKVPQFSWVFKPAAATISDVYKSILDGKETPLVNLTPDQKKKLEEKIAEAAEYQEAYSKYELLYYEALDAYDAAYATESNGGPPIPGSIKGKLKSAYQAWIGLGHKEAYDSAIAVIAAYEALEPEQFWFKLQERYKTGTKEIKEGPQRGSEFQVMGVVPPYKSWFQDPGWTEFTFTQKDMDNQRNSESIGVSGNLQGDFGLFKISGDGSFQQDSEYVKIDQTELNFSCKLMRLMFDRSWMNPLVLSSRAWRWSPGSPSYGSKISTGGDIFGDIAPTGAMTVIPTAAILSKDLVITGQFNDTVVEKFNREIKANASVGIGPFAIAGRFNMENHTGSEEGTIARNEIRAKDVQLIALTCQLLPLSPNPDPSLKWPEQ